MLKDDTKYLLNLENMNMHTDPPESYYTSLDVEEE